jgi:PAS domain S-box-containing protein
VTKKKKSLISVIQLSAYLLMSLLVIAIGSLWVQERINHAQIHTEKIRETSLNNQKDAIKKEIEHVSKYIEHKRDELEKRVKTEVQHRTEEAYQTAQYIYEKNRNNLNLIEIATLIHDALYAASWNEGQGYYFAEDMEGFEQVNRNNPELEGQNIIDLQDSNGKYIVKEILAIARSEKKEGFCSYYWNRPSDPERKVPRISYVKYFKPLDWVIGNGKYIQDEEDKIKHEVIERIENINSSNDRYIFVGTWKGLVLAGPGKGLSMWNISDANGVKIVQELIEKAKNGGGFVSYVTPKFKGQNPEPKISYSTSVPGWNWYVGTGVYIDFIEDEITREQEMLSKSTKEITLQVLMILCFFLLVSYLLIWLFAKKLKNNFDLFVNFFKKSAFQQLTIPPERVSFREFESLAVLANQMVKDRQHAEKAQETSEKRFRQILENISDVYFETRLDGVISYCSPSCLNLSGYSQEELIGSNANILYNDPKDRKLFLTTLQKEGKVRGLELLFKNKNGDLRDVSLNAELAFDENGKPEKINGTIRDVTSTNTEKEQLNRSKKMEAIGLMAGGVAHDLNNILSGIIGYPELLLQTLPKDDALRKPIEAIHESGKRAATVVADLLTVARGAASIREVHNLNTLIEGHVGSLECEHGVFPASLPSLSALDTV